MHRSTAIVCSALLAALFLGVAPSRAAESAHSGSPVSTIPALIDTQYGTKQRSDVSTSDNDQRGHADCGTTEGAAAYKIAGATVGSRLDLAVTQTAGQPLCKVELYRSTTGAGTLSDLYNLTHRANFLVGSRACVTTCAIGWKLSASDTYFVVLWPGGDNPSESATFDLTAQVRAPTSTTLSITGWFDQGASCYRVKRGDPFLARARVSPSTTSTGMMRFALRKYDPATKAFVLVSEDDVPITSGAAQRSFTPSFGRYRVRAIYLGDLDSAPSGSEFRCVDVLTGSNVSQVLSGYGSTSADYFIYRGGRTITVTATIRPLPVTGTVRFRLDRQQPDRSYRFVKYISRSVSGGKAVLRFTIPYRSGVPFYRIRSEYLGDPGHFPKNSAWNCIWIKP